MATAQRPSSGDPLNSLMMSEWDWIGLCSDLADYLVEQLISTDTWGTEF